MGFLLVPLAADALPKGAVGYKLYHQDGGQWVRYRQGDPFPSGGNVWKYDYEVMNYQFSTGVYQFMIFFNSDNILRSTYTSAVAPTGWTILYYPPVAPAVNWKVRFRTTQTQYYVPMNDTLPGCTVQFTWGAPGTAPGPQNYDLVASTGSESGVTHELPPEQTDVAPTTWGRIKASFR